MNKKFIVDIKKKREVYLIMKKNKGGEIMDSLALIIALSAVLWYLIDRFKPLYKDLSFGKWITIGLAAIGAFAFSFGFGLDLLAACNLTPEMTILGQIITGLILMSGSSAVSEIIEKIKLK